MAQSTLKPRKRLVKAKLKEDKLLLFTAKVQAWVEANYKTALYVLLAVIIVAVGVYAYIWSRKTSAAEASFAELLARDAYARGSLDEALGKAEEIIDRYSGSKSAAAALLIKAKVHEQRGEYEQADGAFLKLTGKMDADPYLIFGAYCSLGANALSRKEYVEAAKYYQKAVNKCPDHFNAPNALMEAGQALEKANRYEEAKQVYRQVLEKYPKSRVVDTARNNLASLEFSE